MNLLYPYAHEDNSFQKDNHLANSIKSLGITRLLSLDEITIIRLISADPEVLRYRQAIFDDMKRLPELYDILKKLREYIGDMRDLSRKRAESGHSTEDVLYSFGELKLFIEMITDITAAIEEKQSELKSAALNELFKTLKIISEDKSFGQMKEYIEKLLQSIRFPKSMTIGVNLNSRFEIYEAGIVSINPEYYIGNDLFTSLFSKTSKDGDYRCSSPLVRGDASASLSTAVYSSLNESVARALKKSRSVLLAYIQSTVSSVFSIYEDLAFILRGYEYMSELGEKFIKICSPEFVPADENITFRVRYLINPVLLRKLSSSQIVANDIELPEDHRISLITGPNSGGKSVFLKSVGIAAITAQLGIPIAAKEAVMPLFYSVFCHFPAEDSENDSRLVEECKAMRSILDAIENTNKENPETGLIPLILMDESFSGTGSAEGSVIAEEVLKTIRSLGASCFYSTHLHELSAAVPRLNEKSPKIATLSAEYVSGKRTYRIIRQTPGGKSYAYEIAKMYGLEFKGD